jgi:anti-sigma regulatory factor (Ser/Thr protein kinase)
MDRMYEVMTTFSPELDYRPVVALVMAAAEAVEPPLPESRLADLRLVVTEACSNAVKVHRPDALDRPVVVSCHVDAQGRFCVLVRDRGPGFDPDAVPPLPEPEDPERLEHESGLGVSLIRELADEVHFDPAPDGTVLSVALEPPAAHRPTGG